MKTIAVLSAVLLLPSILVGGEAISFNVTNAVTVGERRNASVDIHVPADMTISTNSTLLVLIGAEQTGKADEFGPPQVFALKGSDREITPGHFRVSIALPMEKVVVRFIVRDKKRTLCYEKRDI